MTLLDSDRVIRAAVMTRAPLVAHFTGGVQVQRLQADQSLKKGPVLLLKLRGGSVSYGPTALPEYQVQAYNTTDDLARASGLLALDEIMKVRTSKIKLVTLETLPVLLEEPQGWFFSFSIVRFTVVQEV